MKRYTLLLFLLFGAVWALFAKEAAREFVVAYYPSSIGFNPLHSFTATEAQIYTALYEGLVSYNPYSLEPIPGAARTWDVSRDRKIYTFYIRGGARYWDGTKVLARHFRDSWLKLLDPKEETPYSFLFDVVKGAKDYRLGLTDNVETIGIRAVSDTVLEVELEAPAPHFLKILCHHSFVPIHPGILDIRDWSGYTSVPGNGPFYIYRRTEEELVFLKNELYWGADRISLSSIKILFIEDPVEITTRFNQGEIHWAANGLVFSLVENNAAISANSLFSTSYFFFSCRNPVFQDPKVRRGLSLLFPWRDIRSLEYNFMPTETLIPRIPQYPEVEGLGRNAEEGLALLKEAGYDEGAGLPKLVITIPDNGESLRIAELMVSGLKEHTLIETEISTFPYSVYYDELKKDSYTVGTITWIGDFADPLTFLQMWTGDSNLNDARYRDDGYDKLVADSMSLSGNERYDKMAEAEGKILKEALVLPISHTPAFNLIDLTKIGGWFPNPLDIHPFRFISFKTPRVKPGIVMY